MTIKSDRLNQSTVVMSLTGRLDTASAPQLERKIKQWGDDIAELILDFQGLEYISSMGLRVLLQTQKNMNLQGRKFIIKNMNDSIREVFEMTGFISLMVKEEKFVIIRKDEGNRITLSLNGQMDSENVPSLAAELAAVRDAGKVSDTETIVILDILKLVSISPNGCRLLKEAIDETAWENRKLRISNMSKDIHGAFQTAGMEALLDG
ncbi:MAG: anti-sigma factor antagonist [Treponema sp.]|nr:anti-sigma factor antagonist [Treponema sp.]